MRTKWCLSLFVFAASLVAAGEAPLQAALEKLPKEARPVELRHARGGALYVLLPNGAEVVLREKHNAPVMAVQAWVRTGAIHEGDALGAGLSHFCEHMLFKGTTRRPAEALAKEVRGAGGDDNAYTTADYTVYHVTGAADGLLKAFDLQADMLMASIFPPAETAKEHAVVYKEIERAMDEPERALWDAWERTMYQVHPYRVPVLGYPERFQRVTREEVFGYYKRRYVPELTTFVAVGDFRTEEVLPRFLETLAAWPRGNAGEVAVPVEPPQVAPREVFVTHPLCRLPKFLLGFPSVDLRHPDLYALDVLASILGDGRSSRLYREVQDRQKLVSSIGAYNSTPRYPGEFVVMATPEPGKLAAARAAALRILEAAASQGATPEELSRAKKKVQTQKVFGEMTAEGQAQQLGSDWVTAGDLDFAETYVAGIQKVTMEEVLRVARQYLDPQKQNFVAVVPPEAAAAEAVKPPAAPAALDNSWLPKDSGATLTRARMLAGLPVWELRLEKSGLRVTLRRDPSLPAVHVVLAALGGQRWEPEAQAGAANLMARMLDSGTATRSKLQIAAQVEDLGARLAAFAGRNSFGIEARGLREDLPALLELGADCLLNSRFAEDEFAKARDETLAEIAETDEELFVRNRKLLRPLLFGFHPYARELLGSAISVAKLRPEDLSRLHADWARPDGLSVCIVGDFEPRAALATVARLFDRANRGAAAPTTIKLEPLTTHKEAEQAIPGVEGAVLTLGFPGPRLTDPDRDAVEALTGLLSGSGGRLNDAIREQQGLAYDVGVYAETQLDGGAIVFYVQTDAAKLGTCLDAMWKEVRKLRDAPPPAAELELVKQQLAGREAAALQDQGDVAMQLALAPLYGQDAAEILTRRERFMKVTPEDIQAAARKYLTDSAWAKAVVKPAASASGEKK